MVSITESQATGKIVPNTMEPTTINTPGTGNSTEEAYDLTSPSYVHIIRHLQAIFGTCGNIFVMRAITNLRKLNSNMYILIFSLCLSDIVTSIPVPVQLIGDLIKFDREKWTYVCWMKTLVALTGILSNGFHLSAMAFDRYVCVTYPHR